MGLACVSFSMIPCNSLCTVCYCINFHSNFAFLSCQHCSMTLIYHWAHQGSCLSNNQVRQTKMSLFQAIIVAQKTISMTNRLVNNVNPERLLASSLLIREYDTYNQDQLLYSKETKLEQKPLFLCGIGTQWTVGLVSSWYIVNLS